MEDTFFANWKIIKIHNIQSQNAWVKRWWPINFYSDMLMCWGMRICLVSKFLCGTQGQTCYDDDDLGFLVQGLPYGPEEPKKVLHDNVLKYTKSVVRACRALMSKGKTVKILKVDDDKS